jgi:hypothetical protein
MKAEQIERIVAQCDGSKKSITETVNRILCEETEISVGATVASVDDDVAVGGFVGKGKVKSFSEDKQWADVEADGGTVFRCPTNLLYLVGK